MKILSYYIKAAASILSRMDAAGVKLALDHFETFTVMIALDVLPASFTSSPR